MSFEHKGHSADDERLMAATRRRRRVEEMRLRGISNPSTLAIAFGVAEEEIHQDLKAIKKDWLKNFRKDIEEKAATRTSQVEAILVMCLNAFDRSRKDKEEISYSQKTCDHPKCVHGIIKGDDGNEECPKCLGSGIIEVQTRKVSGQAGDPRFLTAATHCIMECARIEGLLPGASESMKSALLKSIKTTRLPDGTIMQAVEELHLPENDEEVIKAMAALDQLKYKALESKQVLIEVEAESKEDETNNG